MSIWKPSPKELKEFILNNVNNRLGHDVKAKVMPHVEGFGGCEGIAKDLGASLVSGIKASEVQARQEAYGINYIEPAPPTSFFKFCLDALEDFTLRLLLFFATMSTIIGFSIKHEFECYGYIDGLAIFGTVALVVFVGAAQEKEKENKFRALSEDASEEQVNVLRDGVQQIISVKEVVVGDTVVLSTGDILCCDGIVWERNTLSIFEGPLTGESHPIAKGQYEFKEAGTWEMPPDEDLKQFFPPDMSLDMMKQTYLPTPNKTPIVFAGTQVQDGEGKMVVIAVGENTYQETLLSDKKGDGDEEQEEEESGNRSIMQKKLDDMTILITTGGLVCGGGTLIILLIRLAILFATSSCCFEVFNPEVHIMKIVEYVILGIVIFVVAVPEGLPLAVTIALAFSVGKMYEDKNQVKTSSACETMGSATTICSDKTGTLTTSMMTVMRTYVVGQQMKPEEVNAAVDAPMKELIAHGMTINTSEKTDLVAKTSEKKGMKRVSAMCGLSSKEVKDADAKPVITVMKLDGKTLVAYSGNATECAMLKMVNVLSNYEGEPGDPAMPYKQIRSQFPESMPGRSSIPFSSKRKRMSTLVPMPPSAGNPPHRLYCKGASEMVLELCTKVATKDGSDVEMSAEERANINTAIDDFANQGLRTIAVAYKNLDESPLLFDGTLPEDVETGLTLICIVGIEDPLREEVVGAIQTCRKAGIVVRMVTGDNLSTAKAISRKANILSPNGIESGEEIAMTGEQFRQQVLTHQNMEKPELYINQVEFDKVWPRLRVLARSTPTDKLVLVTGIQKSRIVFECKKDDTGEIFRYNRQVVAVTGDGTNDAPALKQADVGFAMFINGTQVAQKASDIVILDDNFNSIVQAVKWGRSVYDNICRFLQFQLTVNIVACFLAMVGSAILTETPIGVLQLLWVNLIMDSFASLALATEDPNQPNGMKEQVLGRFPYARTAPLLSKIMVRNMFGHAAFQLAVLLFVIFGMGDVCEPGANRNLCAGKPFVDRLFDFRSGRPLEFDKTLMVDYDKWNCVPEYKADLSSTYIKVEGLPLDSSGVKFDGIVPLRAANFNKCSGGHEGCGVPTQHMTMVFHTFVFLQIFNEINARKLHNELNVFKGIEHHHMFIYVFVGTIIVQYLLVELPGLNITFGCTHLEPWMHAFCFLCGLAAIPWNVAVHYMPYEWISLGAWAGAIDETALDELTSKDELTSNEEEDTQTK